MRRKCLGFLALVFVLVASMFSNVFADNRRYWTCIDEYNSPYSVGDTINQICGLSNLTSTNDKTSYVAFESNFEVKSGDELYMYMESYFTGLEEYMDQAASINWLYVKSESGEIICEIRYELAYNTWMEQSDSVTITDETAGKLTVYAGLEGTGTKKIDVQIGAINFELNGGEV